MNFKTVFATALLACGATMSHAAVGGVVFSSDFGSSFGSGSTTFSDLKHTFAALAGGSFKWELGLVATGPITISSVTFSGQTVAGSGKLFSGEGSFSGGPLSIAVSGTTAGRSSYGGSLTVTAVPEPGTYALMLGGLAVVGFLARRRLIG